MNETEFKSTKGAVGLRLEEKGGFKRLEDELASLSTRVPKLGKKTRLVVKRKLIVFCGYLFSSEFGCNRRVIFVSLALVMSLFCELLAC